MNTKTNTPVRCKIIRNAPGEAEAAVQKYWEKMKVREAATAHAREAGIPALKRLFELAETRDSGQIRTVASVLAGLYNGRRFPLNLQDLRTLEPAILDDVLAIIKMDCAPEKEVNEYFYRGEERFEKMFAKFSLGKHQHLDR